MADSNAFLIYQDDNGVSNVNVRFEGEDVSLLAKLGMQLTQPIAILWDENVAQDTIHCVWLN